MAKTGATTKVGTNTSDGTKKDFAGSGVEGQKGVAGDDDKPKPPTDETSEKAASFDKTDASFCVTIRDGGPKRIWFRAGQQIGVEDVG